MRRLGTAAAMVALMLPLPVAGAAPVLTHAPAVIVGRGRGATQSTNWSGYATYRTGTTFTDVKGAWTQPSATCPTRKRQYSSFWVGIDGYNSSSVEQTGTDADCVGKNRPSYYAWYEMYPNPPVNLSMTIHPGDSMSAEVSASGSNFTLTMTNLTTGATFTTTKSLSGAAKTSAEWVAEAPSSCGPFGCSVLPLANFGTANFTGSFTTGNGHTGSISDSAWSNDSITMVTNTGQTKAQPSALSNGGTDFSVTWHHN